MDPKPANAQTAKELLELALTKEKEAHAFYEAFANRYASSVLKEFALALKDDEYRHIKQIEKKLSELNAGRG